MKRLSLLVPGLFGLFLVGCTNSSNIRMEGIAGAMVNQKQPKFSNHVATKFDPTLIETETPRGQLRFSGSIEKNFKPSPQPTKPLPKIKEFKNPVPKAIDNFRARQ